MSTNVAHIKLHQAGWQVLHDGQLLGFRIGLDRAKTLAREHGLVAVMAREPDRILGNTHRGHYKNKTYCTRCGGADVAKLGLCQSCFLHARKDEFSEDVAERHGCRVNGCEYMGAGSLQFCNRHKGRVYSWAKARDMGIREFHAWLADYEEVS